MSKWLYSYGVVLALLAGTWGCGEDNKGIEIAGPDLEEGVGRSYPIESVSFQSVDQVTVSALFGKIPEGEVQDRPVVILVHDLGVGTKDEWGFFFEALLDQGYLPLSIDLRGHGQTPLPDDGRAQANLLLADVENSHLDVQAALIWLSSQQGVDIQRVAVVGNGVGGNVAFVSAGAFPQQVKTAVALSAGLWDLDFNPLVVGAGVESFSPQSVLFMAGEQDFVIDQTGAVITAPNGQPLSYVGFAQLLAGVTEDPKQLQVFPGTNDHGLDLLNNANAVDVLLDWLETYL